MNDTQGQQTCDRCGKRFFPTGEETVISEMDEHGNTTEVVYWCKECQAEDPDYDLLDEE